MAQKIQMRRDTLANWTAANPVLADGEIGFIKGSNKIKIGDGATNFQNLPYLKISWADISDAPNMGDYVTVAALGAAGYQTAAQVDTAITAKGYQTAAQVGTSLANLATSISNAGYQTAAQVQALTLDGGNATG